MNLYKQQIKAISDLRTAVTELNDVLTELITISNKYSADNDEKLLEEMKEKIERNTIKATTLKFEYDVYNKTIDNKSGRRR